MEVAGPLHAVEAAKANNDGAGKENGAVQIGLPAATGCRDTGMASEMGSETAPESVADDASDDHDGNLVGGVVWDAHSRSIFSKLEREFRGRGRSALMQRLALELPEMSISSFDARLEWLARRRAHRARKTALARAWEARKHVLADSVRQLLHEQAVSEGRLRLQKEEAAKLHGRRQQLHSELSRLEAVRKQRDAEAAAEAAEAAAMKQALEEAHAAKVAAERAQKKGLIERYRTEKAEEQRAADAAAAAAAAEEEAEALARAEKNLERVRFRAKQLEAKRQQQLLRREEEARAGEELARRLSAVRERVVASMGIERDAARATAHTAASAQPVVKHAELFPATGYLDDKLMTNMRFKVRRPQPLFCAFVVFRNCCDRWRAGSAQKPQKVLL
eukprot:6197527-Pleurochrysis_carterae.AAC.6